MELKLKRGSVWWVNLDPTQGAEIKKKRPCVLMVPPLINRARRTVLVVPLSTAGEARPPITVGVRCMRKTVLAVCDQIRAVDKGRLVEWIEEMWKEDIDSIGQSLNRILAL
jgi:mRNA interferase MazF